MSNKGHIVSNQIVCNKCGDSIFSQHGHDYVTCSCGASSVDGGQNYLKRVGREEDYTDISIVIETRKISRMLSTMEELRSTHRNDRGVLYGILRDLRDLGLLKEDKDCDRNSS